MKQYFCFICEKWFSQDAVDRMTYLTRKGQSRIVSDPESRVVHDLRPTDAKTNRKYRLQQKRVSNQGEIQ